MTQPLSAVIAAEVRAEAARQRVNAETIGVWLGVSRQSASYRLHGRMPFTTDELQTVADKFGKPLSQFLGAQNGSAA